MAPLISVVIPLHNKEKYVLRAVNSVLSQSEQDVELVVVDDGSTDQSSCLVASLADNKKIRLIRQENAGASAARNRGIHEAQSELVAFLDADDEWLTEFLSTILELRSQSPDANVFGTLYSIQDGNGASSYPNVSAFFQPGYRGLIENYLAVIRSILPFNASSFAVTRKALQQIGGFPAGVNFGEDVDTWIRLSLRYKIVYANRALAIYHRDVEKSACDLYYPSTNEYYPVKNLNQMVRHRQVPSGLRQSAVEYIAKHQLPLATCYLHAGDPKRARELIDTCAGTRIYRKKWLTLYCATLVPPRVLQSAIKIRKTLRG